MAATVLFSLGVAQGNNHKINKGTDGGFPQMLLLFGSGQRKISGGIFRFSAWKESICKSFVFGDFD